ncbi:MAG: hypothetical protein ACRDQ7_17785 [Haloechinothrix sp.]
MTTHVRAARFAAACGLLYPLLLIVGDDVIAPVAGEAPGRGSTPEAVLAWANASDTTQFFAGRFIGGVLAPLCLVVFVVYVVSQIRHRDGSWVADAALGAGILAAGLQMFTMVAHFAAVRGAGELDPATVSALAADLSATFVIAFVPLAVFIAVAGVRAIRGELMARWIGWAALVLAAALVGGQFVAATSDTEVGPAFIPVVFAWFIWFPAASISLILRTRRSTIASTERAPLP